MTALLALGLLASCGEPISNAVFYDEATFLAALPDEERLAVPQRVLDAGLPSDDLLAAAATAAEDLQSALRPLLICADALAIAEPTERDPSFRSWERVPVVLTLEERTLDWWVRGTVVKDESGALSWTMEGAAERIGPWSELARGQHESSGSGWAIWEVGSLLERLDLEGAGLIELRYGHVEGVRALQADYLLTELSADPLRTWTVLGDDTLVWSDRFELTADGATLPGYAIARHTPEGGRADGLLYRADASLPFSGCWDGAGHTTWRAGEQLTPSGSEAACVLPPFEDP